MELIEVTFKPTDAMPIYQGGCPMIDPVTDKPVKPMIVLSEAGEYKLPVGMVAHLCESFPANFTTKADIDWATEQLKGQTIYLKPGEGVLGKKSGMPPSHNRAAQPPGKDK